MGVAAPPLARQVPKPTGSGIRVTRVGTERRDGRVFPGGVSVCRLSRLGRHLSRRLCRTSRHCGSRRRRHLQLLKRAAPSKASEREGGGGGVDRVVLGGGGGGGGIRGPSLSFRGRLCEPAPPPLRSLPPPC